jgi:hypothetical protein
MGGAVPPLPNTPSWRGAQLGGAQGQLYFTFYTSVGQASGVVTKKFHDFAQQFMRKRGLTYIVQLLPTNLRSFTVHMIM